MTEEEKMQIGKLDEQIGALLKRIQTLEVAKNEAYSNYERFLEEKLQTQTQVDTLILLKSGYDATPKNTLFVNRDEIKDKSVQFFDSFLANADKQFLLILDFAYYCYKRATPGIRIAILLTKPNYNGAKLRQDENFKLTPTYIVDDNYNPCYDFLEGFDFDETSPKIRERFVKDEILKIVHKYAGLIPDDVPNHYIPFETPCAFDSQSSKHRSGFGDVYEGSDLVYSKHYGSSDTYPIIGVFFHNRK